MASKLGRWIFGALAGVAMMVAAPRAAEAALVGFCTFSDAGQLDGLQMNGSARAPNGVLFLTPNLVGDNGSAYLKTPVNLSSGTSFQTHFIFRMYFNANDPAGGSGLAFVMQNKAATALSGSGDSLGLKGVGPSVAVEFDTAKDNNGDPNANHVAVIVDGDTKTHLASATPSFNMKNGTDTHVWIDYDHTTTTLKVYIAQNGAKPAAALLTHVINIYQTVDALGAGNKMLIGFSASTAQQNNQNNQDIKYWVFANDGTPLTDCVTCTNSNQCQATPTTPVCNNDPNECQGTPQDPCFCVQCTPTQQGQCVGTPTPVCNPDTNTCVECNDDSHCGGTKPVCMNHVCVPCQNDNGGAQPACNNADRPVCQKPPSTIAGACTQCSSTNQTECTGTTPICLPGDTGTCGCTQDSQCPSGTICVGTPGVCQPGCRPNGTVPCTGGATCVASDAGDGSGTCVQGCDPNNNNCTNPTPACVCPGGMTCVCTQCDQTHPCPSPQICAPSGQCVQCTPGDTTNCDPDGTGGICRPNGQCGCNTDPDCGGNTSGRVCDDANKVCRAGCRGPAFGNGCPTGQRCTSTTAAIGQCVTDPGDAGVDGGNDGGGSSSGGSSSGGSSGTSGTSSSGGSSGTPFPGDAGATDDINVEGGGCNCTMVPGGGAVPAGALAVATIAALALMRRRRRDD